MHLTLLWSPPVTSRAATDTENASNWERLPRRDEFSPALRGLLASVAEDAKASSACDAQRLALLSFGNFSACLKLMARARGRCGGLGWRGSRIRRDEPYARAEGRCGVCEQLGPGAPIQFELSVSAR